MKFIQFLLIVDKGITDYYLKIKQIIKSEAFPYHMQTPTNRKSWTSQEDQTIKILVSIYGIEDWTQISNKLAEQYPQAKRSGKQCRQRWYNHLSPVISKNPWTLDEENKLFRLHREQGNKWKDISKEFVGRTDNDLKNHFYSTLRKSLRRLNKSLGEKNSTSQMRQIKPSVLSKIMNHIYDGESDSNLLDSLKDVPSLIFEFANIKPTKSGLTLKDDEMRDKVLKIFCLISMFNDQYQKGKNNRKERGSGKKEKSQKSTRSKGEEKKQNQSLIQNQIQRQESTLSNQLQSMLDEDNFQYKQDAFHDNTEASMNYSCVNEPFSHLQCDPEQHHDEFNFMFRSNASGIFDEHDEILQAEFQDPEQPSVINDCVFHEAIVGKNIFQRFFEHQTYCTKFVDELLDVHYK